jgi:hypothetical protein
LRDGVDYVLSGISGFVGTVGLMVDDAIIGDLAARPGGEYWKQVHGGRHLGQCGHPETPSDERPYWDCEKRCFNALAPYLLIEAMSLKMSRASEI